MLTFNFQGKASHQWLGLSEVIAGCFQVSFSLVKHFSAYFVPLESEYCAAPTNCPPLGKGTLETHPVERSLVP